MLCSSAVTAGLEVASQCRALLEIVSCSADTYHQLLHPGIDVTNRINLILRIPSRCNCSQFDVQLL